VESLVANNTLGVSPLISMVMVSTEPARARANPATVVQGLGGKMTARRGRARARTFASTERIVAQVTIASGLRRSGEVQAMKVVVAYASDHGSTKGVAGEIADRLTAAGMLVDLNPIDELDAIEGYDAVVLGSAIHNRAWLPQAAAFVQAHRGELAVRPVWLFSVSSVGDTNSFFGPQVGQLMRRMRKESKEIAGFRTALRARDHRNFTGAVERSHWNLAGHVFLKACGGSYGDHRDWKDIDLWADHIARQLLAVENTATG